MLRTVCHRPRSSFALRPRAASAAPARHTSCGTSPPIEVAKPFTGTDAPTPAPSARRNFFGEQVQDVVERLKLPIATVRSVFSQVYARGVLDFTDMIDVPRTARAALQEAYFIDAGGVERDQTADDGTRKWLCNFGGQRVESVFIPEATRGTLCVSSQVGCSFSCKFCHTGTQPVVRNLTAAEIVSQAVLGRRLMYDISDTPGAGKVISNIVFMGQGEPLYNYRAVSRAIALLTEGSGLAFSRRKIIVSTSGVVPNIAKLGQDWKGIGLAISLHAVTDELRDQIVPINRQWNIAQLMAAVRGFNGLNQNNRTLFEYVMLKGVNDSVAEARELARLIQHPTAIPAIVNLIPFNSWPGAPFDCSANDTISAFAEALQAADVAVSVRWPRGRDILAACGQLRTSSSHNKTKAAATDSATPQAASLR